MKRDQGKAKVARIDTALDTADASAGRAAASAASAPAIATIVDVPAPGLARIAFEGRESQVARLVSTVADRSAESLLGREVLVLFEANNPQRPIVTSLMGPSRGFGEEVTFKEADDARLDARVDGREVVIEADKRLELRCGKASIIIDEDGKISIKGAHLYNRATGPIRIKGGHVDIN